MAVLVAGASAGAIGLGLGGLGLVARHDVGVVDYHVRTSGVVVPDLIL